MWGFIRRGARVRASVALVLSLAGCSDKGANSHAVDAGQTSLAASLDASAEGGVALDVDAGPVIDDAAPPAAGDELASRMRHLVEAIAQDNADLAGDVMVPRDAYMLAKDGSDPAKAWEKKVSQGFR